MWTAVAVALFVEMHAADGSVLQVNPHAIVSMRSRGQGANFVEGANCLLSMSDGKFITVRETCLEVFSLIEKSQED